MDTAKTGLKDANKALQQCRKEAKEVRQTFLDDQIDAAAEAEDTTTKKMLKQIRHRDAQSACFR
jgi:DNA-binding ferritin-like protein